MQNTTLHLWLGTSVHWQYRYFVVNFILQRITGAVTTY
jgi:hypothetical protein